MTCLDYTALNSVSPLPKSEPRARNKSVCGVGIYNHNAPVAVNGKTTRAYAAWHDMLVRCYDANLRKKFPTYADCSVVKEWRLFSNFNQWFTENYIEGYDLDKDILVPGNKVYGPDTCVFVSHALNSLLTDRGGCTGEHPLGVHFRKERQKYVARISTEKGRVYLGSFPTPLEAHRAWQLAKADILESFPTDNPRVRKALDLRALQLRTDHAHGRITNKL